MSDKPLSGIALRILLVIETGERTTFNQLRRTPKQPDGFNPRTLSKQLKELEKKRAHPENPPKSKRRKTIPLLPNQNRTQVAR